MKRIIALVLTVCLLITVSITNSNSYAAGGSWKTDSNGWWYEYSDGSYAMGWTEIDGYWYFFTGSGYMDYSEYRDGCWLNADGTWNKAYSGDYWASDSTGWWYTDASGWYPVSTWLWIDGSCYYFKADGYMAVNEWIDGYYVNSSGEMSTEAPTEASTEAPEPSAEAPKQETTEAPASEESSDYWCENCQQFVPASHFAKYGHSGGN